MIGIVTGGTKGIGRAICDLLLNQGWDISLCARKAEDLEKYSEECRVKYPDQKVYTAVVDMSVKNEVIGYVALIKAEFGKVDLLVNNAGTFIPGQIISEEEGTLETMINTNLYSAYYMTRGLVDLMIDKKGGHIFNMCSIASFMAYPNGGSYAISKFALLGFSKCIREELKDKNVKVTSVMPGATWSDSWKGVDLPLERLMKADDIAKSVWSAYNLSDAAVVEEIVLRPQLGDL